MPDPKPPPPSPPLLARLTGGLTGGLAPAGIALSYALGAAGGLAGLTAGLPLGMLIGALIATAVTATLGLRPFGHPVAVPQKWRFVLVPVIGVAIGAYFPADFLTLVRDWWPGLLALLLYVPAAQMLSYLLYRRLGGINRPTAYFAAMPGGFIEAIDMGERAGADMSMLVALQFLRLILCILCIPLGYALFFGQAVGSGADIAAPGSDLPLGLQDAAILLACAVIGWWGAHRLRLPAAVLIGPLAASAVAHAMGLTHASPPDWAILVTQWVMGSSLGARFSGFPRRQIAAALGLSAISVLVVLALAGVMALALSGATGQSVPAVILALAPGGITEMSLVALSLQIAVVFVTLHHLFRIVLAVLVARAGLALFPSLLDCDDAASDKGG